MTTFGEFTKAHRKSLSLSQIDLAERVGCSTPFIYGIERGTQLPSTDMGKRILTALGVQYTEVDSTTLATDFGTFRFNRAIRGQTKLPSITLTDSHLKMKFDDLEKRVASLETLVLSILSREADMR